MIASSACVKDEGMTLLFTLSHVLQKDVIDVYSSNVPLTVRLVLPRIHVVVVHRVEFEQRWQLVLTQDIVIPDVLFNTQGTARDQEPPTVHKDLNPAAASLPEEAEDDS